MIKTLNLVGARVNDDGTNVVLAGADDLGQVTELSFSTENAETLLGAFVSALGHAHRQRTGDKTLKKVLPVEWWEINPQPDRDGMLFSYRLPGGMEMTFHIGAGAIPHYEQVLTTLSGSRPQDIPGGLKN